MAAKFIEKTNRREKNGGPSTSENKTKAGLPTSSAAVLRLNGCIAADEMRASSNWKRPLRYSIAFAATLSFFHHNEPFQLQVQSQELKLVLEDDKPAVQLCGITAILGDYEKSPKEPLEPLDPKFPMFLITDQEHLLYPQQNVLDSTAWTRVRVNSSLWQEDCINEDYVGARNNPCDQPFLFNIGKFYKMQFYRVPELMEAKCNVVIWFDGTIQIKMGSFLGRMADRAEQGQNFVVYVQDGATPYWTDGKVSTEVQRSNFNKYLGRWKGFGPHQHVDMQYQHYLWMGFRERWFENTTWFSESMGIEENYIKYGLYVTCMVMFDLRHEETKPFLDCWWRENILRSTQDQVSFPYCAWKLKVAIHALPDAEAPIGSYEDNAYFRKLKHGK
jgi:hypothetical protein